MKNLNYLMDHILYQIFKIILNKPYNPSIRIYINKIKDGVAFKIKIVHFENLINHFQGSTKDLDCNDFIDTETLFDDIRRKGISLRMYKKIKWNLNRN